MSRFEAWVILKRRPRSVLFIYWIWYTITSAIALLTWKLDPLEDQADRLAIAVGIIFIQMGLKIHSATKTPRMPNITIMDVHSFFAVLLVVLEAVCQVLLVYVCEENGGTNEHESIEDESMEKGSLQLSELNEISMWFNTGLFFVVNIGTYLFAKYKTHTQKKCLEQRLRTLTGFNEEPLEYNRKELHQPVYDLKGHSDRKQPIKITEQDLQHRIEKFRLKREQSGVKRTRIGKCIGCLCTSLCRAYNFD